MGKKYHVNTVLYCGTQGTVELPPGYSWEDVEEWFVKWDTLHYKLKGNDVWHDAELNSTLDDIIDWKRPSGVTIYNEELTEEVDYDQD